MDAAHCLSVRTAHLPSPRVLPGDGGGGQHGPQFALDHPVPVPPGRSTPPCPQRQFIFASFDAPTLPAAQSPSHRSALFPNLTFGPLRSLSITQRLRNGLLHRPPSSEMGIRPSDRFG